VPDGTIYQALEQLLLLDGERISYRALDVEQIGSVYETMMGFRLETAPGRALAIRPAKKHGAPTTISLDALLETQAAKRARWVQEQTERKPPASVNKALQAATSIADLHDALRPIVDMAATPDIVPPGAMVLQPSAERRRSGSHYTPRALTEPIVRTTLEPVLARLRGPDDLPHSAGSGQAPRPDQILDLKVCDPAMGSGAFLVEACRQLGDALIEAWHAHGQAPTIPPDEDEVIYARRLVAQRCLYGVDKNPVAVDLAKVSLWLVTLAREHAFTFVDHALRHGDSLVGLSQRQIAVFHWQDDAKPLQDDFYTNEIRTQVEQAAELRAQIRHAGESVSDAELATLWRTAQDELARVRLYGDLVLAAFFAGKKPKERDNRRLAYAEDVKEGRADQHRAQLEELRQAELALVPFHWEIEFPEVFRRENGGFDVVVGNPPFMSSVDIWSTLGASGRDYLKHIHENTGGKAVDLIAHFFRQAFVLIRKDGTFGLVATNTIAQGDTRAAGLGWICKNGGTIFNVSKRRPWPGSAAVIVSVVHIFKGNCGCTRILDGRNTQGINSFLMPIEKETDPKPLISNKGLSYGGHRIYGNGFTFSDRESAVDSSSLQVMHELIDRNPKNAERIFGYIGGEEINTDPTQAPHRYIISFAAMPLDQAEAWPDLLAVLKEKVYPVRAKLGGYSVADRRREYWWQFGTYAAALQDALSEMERCLVVSNVSTWHAITFQPASHIFAHTVVVFPLESHSAFCALQARPHEIWTRFLASSLGDGLRYTPSDCFETFPFPTDWETHPALEEAGKAYYEYRAELMLRNNEGMTKTYNRFHDPYEQDAAIAELRERHAAMDRAVLAAYGWQDIPTDCEFLLDYEIDEEEWGTKKKPYRYRWPDEVRDEVLARLLELNARRAEAEKLAGAAKPAKQGGRKGRKKVEGMQDMFE
jgi:hypothetical protein